MIATRFLLLFFVMVVLGLVTAAQAEDNQVPVKEAAGSLVICGGGSLPDSVLTRFVELAGGRKGTLIVIPTASDDSRLSDKDAIVRLWSERGLGDVSVLHTRDRKEADSAEFAEPLTKATAVWFSGGQQSRLADAYLRTATERAIADLFHRGGVVGGTSAGAAIQSRVMIQSGNPVPKITSGLDLLPGAIIDQHFLRRNRFNRLLTAIGRHPKRIGVGIDESTAITFQKGECRVLGNSYVTVIRAANGTVTFSVQTFRSGQSFRLDDLSKSVVESD